MAERSFEPVDISDDVLDRFRKLPVATIWQHVMRDAGVQLPFMEDLTLYSAGKKRLAARARTLRFLPPRPDTKVEIAKGEDGPEYRAMARCGPGDVLVADMFGATKS